MRYPFSDLEAAPLSAPIRVLGLGSVQGPDRFGWAVVDALAATPALRRLPAGQVALRRLERPDAATLEALRGARLGVIVDAIATPGRPGQLLRLEGLEGLMAVRGFSSHSVDLTTLLRIGEALGELPQRLIIHGLSIDAGLLLPPAASHQDPGPGIDRAIAACVEAIVDDIRSDSATRGPDDA